MSATKPILVHDGISKPQAMGTTLAHIRETHKGCWLEDTADTCEYRDPAFILEAGHTYVLRPAPKSDDVNHALNFDFVRPSPLQSGTGATWDYQPLSQHNQESIKQALEQHYTEWKKGNEDKTLHPLFLTMWGPGRGKSRTLDEFASICQHVTRHNQELNARFTQNCFVFKTTFENGSTSISENVDHIAVRMLYQLNKHDQLNNKQRPFSQFSENTMKTEEVISSVLDRAGLSSDHRSATIVLLVDSIQKLHMVNPALMHQLLSRLSDMVNSSAPFVVVACSGTFYEPVERVLRASNQRRVFLDPVELDGHRVIPIKDPIIFVLVDDMGGHGRALVALSDALKTVFNVTDLRALTKEHLAKLADFNIDNLLEYVKVQLGNLYPDLQTNADKLVGALRYVLTQEVLQRNTKVTLDYTCEQVVEMGLFSYNTQCKLGCPFVLLCLLNDWCKDRNITHFKLPSYNRLKGVTGIPHAGSFWQDWEEFTAQFRVLKSQVYVLKQREQEAAIQAASNAVQQAITDEETKQAAARLEKARRPNTFRDLHAGALVGSGGNAPIKVYELDGFSKADHHIAPSSAERHCKDNKRKWIINGTSASAGDSFGLLLDVDQNCDVLEVHQNKNILAKVTKRDFLAEMNKSILPNDFFVMLTTHDTDMKAADLPARGAIVSRENFREYFGPYAGRAFFVKMLINRATEHDLLQVQGLGPVKVTRILKARKQGEFAGIDDFLDRANIKRKYAEMFTFD